MGNMPSDSAAKPFLNGYKDDEELMDGSVMDDFNEIMFEIINK